MSSTLDWSDSRARSRFTTAAGPAITALPLETFRLVLDELHATTVAQQSAGGAAPVHGQEPRPSPRQGAAAAGHGSASTRRLGQIEAARQRVADGSYGACFGCGQLIPLATLQAVPYARYCSKCLAEHDRTAEGMRQPGARVRRPPTPGPRRHGHGARQAQGHTEQVPASG
ncbi:MAG: TraR/DksA family transcriptional regulator [Dermatophilaceae bacterium]